MLRAVLRAALLVVVAVSTTPALAQAPPAAWTSLIPPGRYRTLAWRDGAEFVYLLLPGHAPAGARIFMADVADLGVRHRDDVLADLAASHARAIAAHDVLIEPTTAADGVVAWVIRQRDVALTAARDGRGTLTLYVRRPVHAETGGGSGGGGGGGGM
jgi:hypothetical protein